MLKIYAIEVSKFETINNEKIIIIITIIVSEKIMFTLYVEISQSQSLSQLLEFQILVQELGIIVLCLKCEKLIM